MKHPFICTLLVPIHLSFKVRRGHPSLVSLVSVTPTKRQANQHGCMHSLLFDREKEIKKVYGEEKILRTGPTREAKAEQKSIVPAIQAQRTKQRRTLSFVLF
jgi:hypothetical protein